VETKPQSAAPDTPDIVLDDSCSVELPQVDADVVSRHEKVLSHDTKQNDCLTESPQVDAEEVSLCATEPDVKSASSGVNDVNDLSFASELSTASEVDTTTKSNTVSDVPSPVVTSCDTELGTELSICSVGNAHTAAVENDDMKVVSESSACPVDEAPVVACAAVDRPSSSCDDTVEISAAVVKSDDTEDGTQISGCSLSELPVSTAMNSAPAAAVTSRDLETDSKSYSVKEAMSGMLFSLLRSRDQEPSSRENTSEVSSGSASGVKSPATEAGDKSTPTSQPSPGRYLRKSTTVNYSGSPSTNRKALSRPSAVYAARTSSAGGSQKLSEVSPSSSADAGLSASSQDQDASGEQANNGLGESAELASASRHVRHSSEPRVVTEQVAEAVSMDVRAVSEQRTGLSRDGKTASTSSRLYTVGSVSAPSTPLRVKLQISFLAFFILGHITAVHRCGLLLQTN